jgi:hypothetical protein
MVTTAGLTALTMSTVAWLFPAVFPVLAFWPAGVWAVLVAGTVVWVWAVELTSAYVPPDAISDDASATPTTNAGPTVRFDRDDRFGVAAGATIGS